MTPIPVRASVSTSSGTTPSLSITRTAVMSASAQACRSRPAMNVPWPACVPSSPVIGSGTAPSTFRVGQDDLVVGRIHSDDQRWIGRLRRVRELQSPSDRLRCEPGVFTQSRVQNDDVRRRLRRRSNRWGKHNGDRSPTAGAGSKIAAEAGRRASHEGIAVDRGRATHEGIAEDRRCATHERIPTDRGRRGHQVVQPNRSAQPAHVSVVEGGLPDRLQQRPDVDCRRGTVRRCLENAPERPAAA